MITIEKDRVIIPRATWEKLQDSNYYNEIIEAIEDLETYYSEKDETHEYIDYEDYRNNRLTTINV